MSKINKNLDVVLLMDKDRYQIGTKNHYQSKNKKTQIILGGSLRKESNHILHLKNKDFGMTKKWSTFTITRSGIIYQHFDPSYYSDYLGVKDVDKKSISIVLENMGMLFYDVNKEYFVNWINEKCDDNFVYEKLWKNCRYWERYTEEQYNSLALLCEFLIKEYGIERDALGFNVHEPDSIGFYGILTRSNYDSDYSDLNPAFDFQKLLKMLNIPVN